MESNITFFLPFKLRTQLEINVKWDWDKGTPRNGNHVDVQMCKFKTLKGLFHELVYNKDNQKQHVAMFNPKANVSTIKL
jgi:hypothetical protein